MDHDKDLYEIQDAQLTLRRVDDKDKVKCGIIPVDYLQPFSRSRWMVEIRVEFWGVEEVAQRLRPGRY